MKDVAHARPGREVGQGQRIEAESHRAAKAHHEDALAVLGHEVLGVEDAVVHVVAQLLFEHLANDLEGVALVVAFQVLNVLKQDGVRPVVLDDARHVKEKGALRLAGKAVGFPQRVLLGHAGNRERLAREASQQDVVARDVGRLDLGDVALDRMVLAEARDVGLLGELVPFAGPDALAANGLEAQPYPANPREQVNK